MGFCVCVFVCEIGVSADSVLDVNSSRKSKGL